jgi:hypothetical protein
MPGLLFGMGRAVVPDSEAHVRSTTGVVDTSAPSAVMPDTPDWNEFESDPDTEGGLTTRQLASHVIPMSKYAPHLGNANTDFNAPIDSQVSTSGHAAAQEAAGVWGHGTMQIVEGIEPTIVDGHQLGDEYFKAGVTDNPSINGVRPPVNSDPNTAAQSAATGELAARKAVQRSMYADWLNAATGK